MSKGIKNNTLSVHGGQDGAQKFSFPVPSIVPNSAVLLKSVEEGWEMLTNENIENIAYQRYSNPTVSTLEKKFSALEGSKYSLAVNSGMTACYLVFRALLTNGDHVITQHSLYHEVTDQLKYDKDGCGIDHTIIEKYDIENFSKEITKKTRMIFIESPTMPVMHDVDIKRLAQLCKKNKIILIVDNTLLTVLYQKPLSLGADITVQSTTKAINGHGDSLGGIISTNNKNLYVKLVDFRSNTGLIMDPYSAWNTARGLRTLALRLERHTQNTLKVINFLQKEYPDYKLLYPAFGKNYKRNKVAGGGGIVSIVLHSKEQGLEFIRSLKLVRIGTTFGNLESLCYHFGGFARPSRDITKIGIPLGLVRLSIGIEDIEDIIADIRQALDKSNVS